MANKKEVKSHIESVSEIQTLTGAMYLIASTKLRRAKTDLKNARGCFSTLHSILPELSSHKEVKKSRYFRKNETGSVGIVVITADKGLAGSYNYNVIRKTNALVEEHEGAKLFVVGDYGRQYYAKHKVNMQEDFSFSPEGYVLRTARNVTDILLKQFDEGELSEIYVVFTDFSGGMSAEAKVERLLPLPCEEGGKTSETEFFPSTEEVVRTIVPTYVTIFLYGAITDSFCCEQNARMTAMDAANRNAEKLIDELSVKYDHIRQNTITQEIIEVSAGVNRQRQKGE